MPIPTTNNQQPTTNNQQPTTNNQQPTTNNQQPTTNNQQPRYTPYAPLHALHALRSATLRRYRYTYALRSATRYTLHATRYTPYTTPPAPEWLNGTAGRGRERYSFEKHEGLNRVVCGSGWGMLGLYSDVGGNPAEYWLAIPLTIHLKRRKK